MKKHSPVIILPGISHSMTYLYDKNDNPVLDDNGKHIGDSLIIANVRGAKAAFPALAKALLKSAVTQGKSGVYESAYNLVKEVLSFQKCNMSGDFVENLKTKRYYSLAQMTPEELNWAYTMVPLESLADEIGKENIFFYTFNLVGDPLKSAAVLDEYIDEVLVQTRSEKATLMPISLGGSILTAYLDLFGHEKIGAIVNVVACLNGTDISADLMARNFNVENSFLRHEFLPTVVKEETGRGTKGYAFNSLSHILPKGAFNAMLSGFASSAVDNFMVNCPQVWAILPHYRYDELATRYLSAPNYWTLKDRTDRFQQARLNLKDNLLKAKDSGVKINFIAGSNLNFGERMYSMFSIMGSEKKYNSDGIVNLEGATLGAYGAPNGEKLPENYPKSEYISPDGRIDAGAALIPENTWIFLDQYHEVGRNSAVLNLIKAIILGEIEDVHTNPKKYPQFNYFQDTHELRRNIYPSLIKTRTEIEKHLLWVSQKQKKELDLAIEKAEKVLSATVADAEKADDALGTAMNVLTRLGKVKEKEMPRKKDVILENSLEFSSEMLVKTLGAGNLFDIFRR